MNCQHAREILIDLSGAVNRAEALAALQHLESCDACREAMRKFDRIAQALATPAQEPVPPGGWAEFERRLASNLRPARWNVFAVGYWPAAAAVFLAVFVALEAGRLKSPAPIKQVQSDRFVPAELSDDVGAFEQVSKVFDGRAGWMLVSKEASDVGVTSDALGRSPHVILLRLAMSRGDSTISDADLMIIPGQNADLKVPIGNEQALHYRIGVSATEPTRLSIWFEVTAGGEGQALGAMSTSLRADPGDRLSAGQLVTSAGDYSLTIGFARGTMEEGEP